MMPFSAYDRPRVSVIIPAYRVAPYVREALGSVLSQADTTVEVILVNDGSPDTAELEAVISEFRSRIKYICRENGGVSRARNTGIQAAGAEWLAFLDADDIWLPGYLKEQFAVLEADKSIDMVFTDSIWFGDTDTPGVRSESSSTCTEVTLLQALAGESPIGYCCLVRKDAVMKAGLFDADLRGSEDYNLWIRILKSGGKIVHQKKALFCYRRRKGSATSNAVWMNERILESFAKIESTLPLAPDELAALHSHRQKIQFQLAVAKGKRALQKRDWETASVHFREARDLRPTVKSRLIVFLLSFFPAVTHKLLQWWEKEA